MRCKQFFWSILLVISLVSCSPDEDIPYESIIFEPPSWIIGAWDNEDPEAFTETLIFTEINIVSEFKDGSTLDYSQSIAPNRDNTIIEEVATDNEYSIIVRVSFPDGEELVFTNTFKKTSLTSLTVYDNLQEIGTFVKR
ncbi:hypothetical protein [uncultured Aquimarina sp.]|uniref:hypothetical protein n=1 Tax=uncultured Aquimarina sp. TaxID=575652 RepID=UPI002603BFD3|nr:hypothetical protein [uncultured Aquimarina sp.]